MWDDLRFGWRTLRRSPAFTVVAVVSLALGIGANVSIFSLVDQVLVRSLPVQEPQRLVGLYAFGPWQGMSMSDASQTVFSYPLYRDVRDRGQVLSGLAARAGATVNVSSQDQTERARVEIVSGNFFEVLGVRAALGRTLTPEDDRIAGGHPVVVLGHGYWQRRFGGSPAILNQRVQVNGYPMTVIGVTPARFYGVVSGQTPDLYVPIAMKRTMTPTWDGLEDRRVRWLNLVGRLRAGEPLRGAEEALQVAWRPLLEQELALMGNPPPGRFRERFLGQRLELRSAAQGIHELRRRWETPLLALMGMVGLVLVISCANVANLLLARAAGREREIAIRLAMGAGRAAIVRRLLMESLILAVSGGLLGLLLAAWSTEGLLRLLPVEATGGQLSGQLDWRLLGFCLGLSVVSAVLFGLVPAWQATRDQVASALKDQATSTAGGRRPTRLRQALVVAQVALSVALVAGAGLFTRSLTNLLRYDPGFRVENLTTFSLSPRLSGYPPARTIALARELQERLAALGGVRGVAAAEIPRLTNSNRGANVTVEGYRAREDEDTDCRLNAVTPEYFRTLGIRLVDGREFTPADGATAPKVVVVSEAFARYFFGSQNPIGRRMTFGAGNVRLDREIVGVVGDSRHASLREATTRFVYTPYAQEENPGRITFYVRAAGEERALAGEIRRLVRQLDAGLPVFDLKSMQVQLEESIATERVIAVLSGAFGLVAAVLAAIGLYGVIAYTVVRRTREIGIRMALGATRSAVVGLVLREVAGLAAAGIGLGVAGAVLGGRWVESQLFGVRGSDPLVLAGAALALAVVALAAGGVPAGRAARLEAMVALRHE